MGRTYTQSDLSNLKQNHSFLVALDSDGCVFGTMDVKQKIHFHPKIIEIWGLEEIESVLREVAEFVYLRSKWRGGNRFRNLLQTFKFLSSHPVAIASGVELPNYASLEEYCSSKATMGHESLEDAIRETNDQNLKKVFRWSQAISHETAVNMKPVPPFRWALKCLDRLRDKADLIVVSQTPTDTLIDEWSTHGIDGRVQVIGGQELGTKAEQLMLAREGRYESKHVLMVGDAPGDRIAAEEAGVLFFPINTDAEESSWKCLHQEALGLFLGGQYTASYQKRLVDRFEELLPATPPWRIIHPSSGGRGSV